MEVSHIETTKLPEIKGSLEQAWRMADWFVPYVYEGEAETGEISLIAQDRISNIVGKHESDQQLDFIKALINEIPAEHRHNAIMYCLGYPRDALGVLADGDVDVTAGLLVAAGAQYMPVVRGPRREATPNVEVSSEMSPVRTPQSIALHVSRVAISIVNPNYTDLSWQKQSLCAQTDPEAFFPEKGGSSRDAKKICNSCEVREQCLSYALANNERFGIWGGASERERRRLADSSPRITPRAASAPTDS